jgi:cold shock CspA family protein/ribosome-associated translation inhibitor RaiA
METPVRIDFQCLDANESIRASVIKHISALEERYGRITACRVVIKGPGDRHRTGGLYEINIHLSLPQGREVNVGRTADADERHADPDFAINDAFRRTRRRLQDHSRQLRGQVKTHEDQPIATVTRLDEMGGFGFLESADGREIYFHKNSVLNDAFSRLAPGARVAFSEAMGDKGPQASTVRLIGKHGLR